MEATILDSWNLVKHYDFESGHWFEVLDPSPADQVDVLYVFGNIQKNPLIQFDTTLPGGSTIISATISRHKVLHDTNIPLNYYLGTWASTPPAANEETFNGGTLAGNETPNMTEDAVIDLDKSLINISGTTSLRIETYGEGFVNFTEYLTDLILTIEYSTPEAIIKKISFAKIQ